MPLDYNTFDGEDLMGYAEFELGGYRFESWQPCRDGALRQWVLRVYKGDEKIREETVPMFYPNIFGPDVSDVADLERRTEEVIKELGLE